MAGPSDRGLLNRSGGGPGSTERDDMGDIGISQLHDVPARLRSPALRSQSPLNRPGSRSPRLPRSPRVNPSILRTSVLQDRSDSPLRDSAYANDQKEAADWYIEGPGRRVGYDDLTAIDWIFEYTKERQRIRNLLSNSRGLAGSLRQLLDASHVWFVLIATGLAVGLLAAVINIASDWLGDIKTGYCKTVAGTEQFYLNKQFCCWGHDDFAKCQDWTPWRKAWGITSTGGGYVVEYIAFITFSVLFAISSAVLVKHYSLYAKHSGIPEIKTVLEGFIIRRFMGPWTLITKSFGLCLAVASGLWLGKEGPLVHLACCCSNIIMKPFESLSRNEARKREVLSAAAASGISVAFGSPIGGVLFSLEQLSYYFPDKTMWQSFVCAMVAAVTLQALNPFHTGKIVLYQVTYNTSWHNFEIVPFVLLGIIGGIYGGLFIHLNMFIAEVRRSDYYPLRDRKVLEVLVVSLLAALINFPNNFMRAQLSELVYYLFAECAAIGNNDIFGLCKVTTAGSLSMASLLVTAAGLGFLLASITFGLQIPAGIILPSLAIGALYGRATGVIVELIYKHSPGSVIFAACVPDVPCITPGIYAIVGAASALAGVTRMTVSIVVIMFELTGALTYVLPIMVAVMLAKWIGDAISKRGIYEAWIYFNEYPYLDNKDDSQIPHIPVTNVMTRMEEMTYLDAAHIYTIAELRKLLRSSSVRGFPVILLRRTDSDMGDSTILLTQRLHQNTFLGYISRAELNFALENALNANIHTSAPNNREMTQETHCYFVYNQEVSSGEGLDLRPWMDQTPITLNVNSTFQLAVNMFQSLGLRYLLLIERGAFRGILTKKDVWWILNARETVNKTPGFVAGAGVLREDDETNVEGDDDDDDQQEARGLLRDDVAHQHISVDRPS